MELNITGKQYEVLRLRSLGVGNKEIAARLNLSQNAIHSRISILCESLNARDIAHAIAKGFEIGIIGEDNGRYVAIQELNTKIETLGLTEVAHDYLLDRFGLSVLSCRPSHDQIDAYLKYMTAFIDLIEKPFGTTR